MAKIVAILFLITMPTAQAYDQDELQFCLNFAEFMERVVVNRDAGLPLETAIDHLELLLSKDQVNTAEALTRFVYSDKNLTRKQAYEETFVGCVNSLQ